MRNVHISSETLDRLREIQGKQRSDCIAAFTVAQGGPIWPFGSQGNTPEELRGVDARGCIPVLDEIADELMRQPDKKEGGRFFIDNIGAFYRPGNGNADTRFVEFIY